MEKPTASDSGTNSSRAAPSMKNDGRNTARMHSIASRRGTAVSVVPCQTARAIEPVCSICDVDVLDRDGRLIDEDADRQRQPAQRHQVERLAGHPQGDHRRQQREGNVEHDDDDRAPVAQEQQHHQPGQHGAERALAGDARPWPG